jgi:hypothetical protein
VCTAEGADTQLGPDPLREQLRVDFMITDLLRKVPACIGDLRWCCSSRTHHVCNLQNCPCCRRMAL